MYENIKVFVADIDSTLRAGYGISKKTVETIEKVRDKGILFGLASGRPFDNIEEIYKDWGMRDQFDFLVCWNGCQLYDNKTKQLNHYNFIDKNDIKEIIEIMRPFDCVVSMFKDDLYLCNLATEKAMFSAEKSLRTFALANDESEFYEHDNGGIMFRTTPEMMPTIENLLKEKTKNKNYVGFKTQPNLMEFAHKDSNKGYAFKKYCERYSISLDDCMAFGDTTNDNEMLKCCHGVCLLNGSDDTKACAERITDIDCAHDGWADFVEKYIFKENNNG